MKYEVARRFRDKYTGEIILPGATFICDDNDRIKDLIRRGIIKQEYESMTKRAISEVLKKKGIEHNLKQTKAELYLLLQGGG